MKKLIIPFALLLPLIALAKPSGGPYGPQQKTYDIPQTDGQVYYVATDAPETNSGKSIKTPISIKKAITLVKTNDVIVLRGGTYRTGDLQISQGITMIPFRDEKPVFKGTLVADKWEKQKNGVWKAHWDTLFPETAPDWWSRSSFGKTTPPYIFNYDMVFIDGKLLKTVGWEGDLDENSFCIDYEKGNVYIATDPTNHLVEITAFDNALTRTTKTVHGKANDKVGLKIYGITFTQYAYRALEIEGTEGHAPTTPDKIGKEVVGSVVENVTISYCSRTGAYFRGDDLVIRNCMVSDTGYEGLYVISSQNALLENSIVTRTNIQNIQGVFATAVKIFNQCDKAIVRNNLIIDNPDSSGVWYDVGNTDGLIYNNYIENTPNGFFFEISRGAKCFGNVFVDCDTGIFVLNSCDVEIYNNTLYNSAVQIMRNGRTAENDSTFGWHAATAPTVENRNGHILRNNLMVVDKPRAKTPYWRDLDTSLLIVYQDKEVDEIATTPLVKEADSNVFVRIGNSINKNLIYWTPSNVEKEAFSTLQEFQTELPEFGKNSIELNLAEGSFFKCKELGDFHLTQPISEDFIPAYIKSLSAVPFYTPSNTAGAY
jgi:hypothetical protein